MIARIKGVVVEKPAEGMLIVDVGGVGYAINVPDGVFEDANNDQDILLYTHDHIRENARNLFGFTDTASKDLFEMLIGVSGVGPRGAIAIMGLGPADQIRKAIASGNVAYISGASGVGKRIAERVTVDLKDKVGVIAGQDVMGNIDSGDDALEALQALGYSANQSVHALSRVEKDLSTEERVRAALKELS